MMRKAAVLDRGVAVWDAFHAIDWGQQITRNWSALLVASGFAGLTIAGVWVLAQITGSELSELTRDVVAVVDTHLYTGVLSTLGIMLWSAASAVCLLAAFVLSRREEQRGSAFFLLCGGSLTLWLGLDDALLLHERVIPTYLGVPQLGVYAVYVGLMGAFLLGFAHRILATQFVLLGVSLVFMALSMGMDELLPYSRFETFVEDCCKFVGIVFWLAYFSCTAARLLEGPPPVTR